MGVDGLRNQPDQQGYNFVDDDQRSHNKHFKQHDLLGIGVG